MNNIVKLVHRWNRGGTVTPTPSDNILSFTSISTSASISRTPISFSVDTLVTTEITGDITPLTLNEQSVSGFSALDFSANLGTVNVTMEDVTNMTVFQINNGGIATLNVTKAINLDRLNPYANNLVTIDISQNPLLYELLLYNNSLTALDISNNPLLTNVTIINNSIGTTDIDNIYIQLDTNGLSGGVLWVDTGIRSIASDTARANLITKGWTITD